MYAIPLLALHIFLDKTQKNPSETHCLPFSLEFFVFLILANIFFFSPFNVCCCFFSSFLRREIVSLSTISAVPLFHFQCEEKKKERTESNLTSNKSRSQIELTNGNTFVCRSLKIICQTTTLRGSRTHKSWISLIFDIWVRLFLLPPSSLSLSFSTRVNCVPLWRKYSQFSFWKVFEAHNDTFGNQTKTICAQME